MADNNVNNQKVEDVPFEPCEDQPNAETLEALQEAERIIRTPSVRKYTIEEALKALKS